MICERFVLISNTPVRRDDEVRSAGLRDKRGRVLMATRGHSRFWAGAPETGSTESFMRLPIFNQGAQWADLEIVYAEADAQTILVELWARPVTKIILTMAVLGFIANLFYMKRILKHLDPSQVIPTRVQTALDVMADGVLLIDAEERIVLANGAFCEKTELSRASLLGMSASSLAWDTAKATSNSYRVPWEVAIREGESAMDVPISIMPAGAEEPIEFRVSGSPVLNGLSQSKGAIVTFKDVTELERQRRALEGAMTELEKSRDEIRIQNEELELLASTDPLTGLANRRTFMDAYGEFFEATRKAGTPLSCLMVDIDFFKRVNDDHGHAMGDEIICQVAQVLKDHSESVGLAGRYGGEEFCVALPNMTSEGAMEIAERMRETIGAPAFARIPVTVSIGIASTESGARSYTVLIEEADESLYASKRNGRNRVTRYDQIVR